ncbi:MAG: response regulator [Tannerella sp.]|jgi:ligand-binding sensor domain-containing protein/signal transduction histidine kinase/DNA-binding response OmpR family regulator|nr:response regulator [Tannerella sp.]
MKKILFLCLLIFFPAAVHAGDINVSNYYFSHITVENGLSQSNVKAVLQDSYGFMWFGTKNGLNRYDGSSIVRKDCDDFVAGTGNHNISALYEDGERILWVGTDRGVYRYNPATDIFTSLNIRTKDSIDMNNWVADITGDKAGNIWVVIPDQGVFRYKNGELFFYELTDKENLKTEAPDCICIRANGEVWVGSWGVGLFRYNEKKDAFEHYVSDRNGRSLKGKNINYICDYGEWIAMAIQEGEVLKYNPQTNELADIKLPEASETFVRNVKSIDGDLWVGTFEGLFIVSGNDGGTVRLIPDLMRPFSLSDKFVYCIYQDSEGGVWIGTMFGGVSYLPRRNMPIRKYVPGSDDYSLSTKRVREIAEDSEGNIWIGTEDGGLNVLDVRTGRVRRVNYPADGINHYMTLAVSIIDNQVLCGLFKQGMDVVQLPEGVIRHYSPEQLGMGEGTVYSFLKDSRGRRWIGTGWGLCMSEPDGTAKLKRVDETGYDWIFDIFEDSGGTLWFATMGNGLWRLSSEDGVFKKYEHEKGNDKSLSSNSISSIMQDSRGSLWLSTDRGGICRYNRQTDDFTTFSLKDGLPDDVSYKILEDEANNLWFGTNRGLVCFNPETKYIRVFTANDGLLGNQFNYKSALKARDGRFFFGGIEGLIAFDPNTTEAAHAQYPVYITRFSIYNHEVTVHIPNSPLKQCINHTDRITLNYSQSSISFDVALLSYSTTASNRYQYRMTPVDDDWISAESNHNISYSKLPAGEYVFEVRANDGRSGGTFSQCALQIQILPPWWQTLWAYILYACFSVALLLCWFFWYRKHKDKQMDERQKLFEIEKERELSEAKISFFTSIAHEIRTPLTLINAPLETIGGMNLEDAKLKKNLSVIEQNTRRLLDLTGQLLDFQKIGAERFDLKYENVDVTKLLNDTLARFEPTILLKKKELLKNIPDLSIAASIDCEAITKILSNLLNNALKYARQTIMVELTADETSFTVRVSSDGDKIPQELENLIFEPFYQIDRKREPRQGVGIGLPLARSLAMLHKGCLNLDVSQPDNTFTLTIPLNRAETLKQAEKAVEQNNILLGEDISPVSEEEMKGYTLLLAEDNEDMLTFILERLEETFRVETAHNGQEALDILHSSHIDLVISDIVMPVMNGYELCRAIKSDIDLCHIPVIFLTAKNDLDSKINGLKLGAEAYVEKPFSFNYLQTQIRSLLDNRRKEREAFSKRPFFPVHNMQMNKGDEEFANRVIKMIEKNITDQNFGVERLAEDMCMSRSNLLRKIKNLFNLSPVDFIRLIRLKKAAELIQEGVFRIGDICYMVGINSPSYFGKQFQKQFGMTPKEFEKQQRGKT